jgi:calcineurin-like phosphoesterase family protein
MSASQAETAESSDLPEPEMPEQPEAEPDAEPDYDSEETVDTGYEAGMDLSEYGESYLQLGDFEHENVSPELLEEAYGDADLDGIIYHGDLTKVKLEGDEYNDNALSSYENLDRIGEILDTEVYLIPGNNDPDGSELLSGKDRDAKDTDGRPGDERLEAFAQYLEGEGYEVEGDPHSSIVSQLENVEDARDMDAGSEIDLIFMGNHFDPELNEEAYNAIFEGPGVEEFYGEEDLEEIASYLEEERSQAYPLFEKIPFIGKLFKNIGKVDVDPDTLGLEDVPEEFMDEGHREYQRAVEELEEEYGDQIEAFQSSLDALFSRIEEVDRPAIVNHSVPYGDQNPHGSMVLKEAVKEYGEELEFVSGGHMHSPGIEEMHGTDVVNSAEVITEIGVGEEVEYNINQGLRASSGREEEQEMPEPEEAKEMIESRLQRIDNLQSNPELDEEEREQLDQMQQQLEAEKDRLEEELETA